MRLRDHAVDCTLEAIDWLSIRVVWACIHLEGIGPIDIKGAGRLWREMLYTDSMRRLFRERDNQPKGRRHGNEGPA